jgi:hypothetical protein
MAASNAGTYDSSENIFSMYNTANQWELGNQAFETVTITEYGGLNEPIKGIFNGTMQNTYSQPVQTVTVTGEFSVLND